MFGPQVVQAAHDCDCAALPGAFTSTEIPRAHEYGADVVKVFPASTVGMDFIDVVRTPLPHFNLMPTGRVSLSNARVGLEAGAAAVNIRSALVDRDAIANENHEVLKQNARTLRNNLER